MFHRRNDGSRMVYGDKIRHKRRDDANVGLTVAEATIGLFGTALLLTVTMKVLLTSWLGCNAITSRLEADAAWLSTERVLETDLHAATTTMTSNGSLSISTMNGTSYRYLVNSDQELIRMEQGGGVSVVSTGIVSFRATSASGLVHVFATFADGSSHELTIAPLGTFEP